MTHFTNKAQDLCLEIQRQTVSFNILAVAFYVPAPPSEDTIFFSDNSLPVWRCCHKQSNPNSKLAHFTQFLITSSNSKFDNHCQGTLAPQVRNVNSHSRKFLGVWEQQRRAETDEIHYTDDIFRSKLLVSAEPKHQCNIQIPATTVETRLP